MVIMTDATKKRFDIVLHALKTGISLIIQGPTSASVDEESQGDQSRWGLECKNEQLLQQSHRGDAL
jgi:hypothetical protein